ncbi:MAG: MBL fold metallo-hydrolase [Dehalococcoidia bacterium]|nr:MBL fold metallo-hydrolase [Dehalococcoidia bacterium]
MISATSYREVLQIRMSRYADFPSGTWVCAYLVNGLLVDTGPAYTAAELVEFLRDKQLETVVNTHFHEDHISANKLLQDAYKVRIYAHPDGVDKIAGEAKLYPYQEDVWGYPVPSRVEVLGDYVEAGGRRFDVIHTPGHEIDHVCLFQKKEGWLFTGDLYVTTRPVVCRPNDDMLQTLADLKKLRSLNPVVMFPAPTHVVKEPMEKLNKLIAYLEELGGRIDGLYNKGMSYDEIRKEVFGEEGFICDATQQQFSSLSMVKSFLRKYD